MIDLLSVVAVSLYAGVLALLLPFAAHRMVLLFQSRKRSGEGGVGVDGIGVDAVGADGVGVSRVGADGVGAHNMYFTQNTYSPGSRRLVRDRLPSRRPG